MKKLILLSSLICLNAFAALPNGCEWVASNMAGWRFINEDELQIDANTIETIQSGPLIFGDKVYYQVLVVEEYMQIQELYEVTLDKSNCNYLGIKTLSKGHYNKPLTSRD